MAIRSTPSAALLAAVIAATHALIPACKKSEPNPVGAAQPGVETHRYTVRGIVEQLPSESEPTLEFQVRHEAIPHFVGQDGVLGMDTMTMPFPLAEGLSLGALKVKDKVELTFEVDFDSASKSLLAYRAVAVAPLPAETTLDFSRLRK